MCGLMLQIVQTRILSVQVYYHLAFFAIGVAMLGMTAGALWVFYRTERELSETELHGLMSSVMSLFGWSVLGSLLVLLNVALNALFEPTLSFVLTWGLAILILLPPYVLLGITICLALTRSRQRVGLVYAVDLFGAAGGCLLTLALLSLIDTYSAVLIVGGIGALAALCFTRAGAAPPALTPAFLPAWALRPLPALLGVLTAALLNLALGTHGLRPLVVKNRVESAASLTAERWNSFSRVAFVMEPQSRPFLWSASKRVPEMVIDQGYLVIDGAAGTPIYHYTGERADIEFLRYDLTALAYFIRHSGRAAVIGIGGGRDLLTASLFGFADVTGVEYNPIFVRLFARDYRAFSGADRIPGLRLEVDDARSWFARSTEQFDLIQMSLIDTWAATGAGAFTLSENGLYTVDGWKRFMARLSPAGIFTVSRWYAEEHLDETARILSLAMATLMEAHAADPAAHLYLASNRRLSTLIVGRAPLSAADVRTLDATVERMGYRTLVAPHRPAADPAFERILGARTARELVEFGRAQPLNLAPTWDTNPFFFNQLRLTDPVSMARAIGSSPGVVRGNLTASLTLLTLIVLSLLVVLAVVVLPARGAVRGVEAGVRRWSTAYFLVIGVAFMCVEISLIQRMSVFLGHPVYGLAIVLFSLVLATGLGSALSGRLFPLTASAALLWPLVLAGYLAALPFALGSVLPATETGPLVERAAVCVAVMLPAGALMGFMFPTGMRLASQLAPGATPWLWAVNGAAGVLASGTAVLLTIETSLNQALWLAAAGYAALSVIALRLLRLTQPAQSSARPAPAHA
ncbi:MAG: hypothetical protein JO341_14875 [Gammaproteobacteria bacterium]|nr:hypothetical protein [Gammaproteobacteria bacterium]MBV9622290.1 hypothetical protein [Gammaproteobacteria bacterium]